MPPPPMCSSRRYGPTDRSRAGSSEPAAGAVRAPSRTVSASPGILERSVTRPPSHPPQGRATILRLHSFPKKDCTGRAWRETLPPGDRFPRQTFDLAIDSLERVDRLLDRGVKSTRVLAAPIVEPRFQGNQVADQFVARDQKLAQGGENELSKAGSLVDAETLIPFNAVGDPTIDALSSELPLQVRLVGSMIRERTRI